MTTDNKTLLGFVALTLDSELTQDSILTSDAETTTLTKLFLNQVATSYFENLKNLWIDRHIETIEVDGINHILTGTKYKCIAPQEDDYAWVVINQHQQVMI